MAHGLYVIRQLAQMRSETPEMNRYDGILPLFDRWLVQVHLVTPFSHPYLIGGLFRSPSKDTNVERVCPNPGGAGGVH